MKSHFYYPFDSLVTIQLGLPSKHIEFNIFVHTVEWLHANVNKMYF